MVGPYTPPHTEKNYALIYITLLFLHYSFLFKTSFLPIHHQKGVCRERLSLASAGGMLCLHVLSLFQAFEELRKLTDGIDDRTKLLQKEEDGIWQIKIQKYMGLKKERNSIVTNTLVSRHVKIHTPITTKSRNVIPWRRRWQWGRSCQQNESNKPLL